MSLFAQIVRTMINVVTLPARSDHREDVDALGKLAVTGRTE